METVKKDPEEGAQNPLVDLPPLIWVSILQYTLHLKSRIHKKDLKGMPVPHGWPAQVAQMPTLSSREAM